MSGVMEQGGFEVNRASGVQEIKKSQNNKHLVSAVVGITPALGA